MNLLYDVRCLISARPNVFIGLVIGLLVVCILVTVIAQLKSTFSCESAIAAYDEAKKANSPMEALGYLEVQKRCNDKE